MWTAIPAIVSLVAALACAMLFGCAQPERAPEPAPPTRTADAGTDCSATPGAAIVWRHCDKHATTRPHFDVRQ